MSSDLNDEETLNFSANMCNNDRGITTFVRKHNFQCKRKEIKSKHCHPKLNYKISVETKDVYYTDITIVHSDVI